MPWLREKCGSDVDITDAGVGCNGYSVSPWPYEERYHPTSWVTSKSIDFLRRRELYFDILSDPNNLHDLADQKGERVTYLRGKLIKELTGREEGYVENGALLAGCTAIPVLTEAGLE